MRGYNLVLSFVLIGCMLSLNVLGANEIFQFNNDISKVIVNGEISARDGSFNLLSSDNGYIQVMSKLGIGVRYPSRSLEVASENSQAQLVLKDPSANVDSKNWFLQSRLGDFRIGTFDDSFTSGGSGNFLAIKHNGNAGIGVMNPVSKLEVKGNIFGKVLHIQPYAGSENKRKPIEVNQGAYISWNVECSAGTNCNGATYIMNNRGLGKGGIVFASLDKDTNKLEKKMMSLESNGDLEVNNDVFAKSYKLKDDLVIDTKDSKLIDLSLKSWVNDDNKKAGYYIYAQDTLSNVGPDFYVNAYGDVYSRTNSFSSSIRYKKDIKTIDNASWIYSLRPVRYAFKNRNDGDKYYGFIAEEVDKINSDVVVVDSKGRPDSLRYIDLIAPMVKLLKEQKGEINTLKSELCKKDSSYSWCFKN